MILDWLADSLPPFVEEIVAEVEVLDDIVRIIAVALLLVGVALMFDVLLC